MRVSMDIRRRVVKGLERGESGASIGRRLEISTKTIIRLKRKHQNGEDLTPAKPGPKGPTRLTQADHALMREQVARNPGITAKQLMPMLGVEVAESTVCRPRK